MKSIIIAQVLFFVSAESLVACPLTSLDGVEVHASSTDLWAPQRFQVTAGGSEEISHCPIRPRNASGVYGYFTQAPDFELRYYKNRNLGLMFQVESGCDSALLINTGANNWYFDDDDAGNFDPRIYLTRPSEGWYDIWIGTVPAPNCNAVLHIETFTVN